MREILVGVDGGGSKTACLAVDFAGPATGYAVGGPSNHHAVTAERAGQALCSTILEALGQAGATPGEVRALCAGLAGYDSPDDRAVAHAMLAPLALPVVPLVVNDARVALAGAFANQPGIVVIAGTGSIILGQDAGGRTVRAGGWGPVLGDEGSGYDVGRRGAVAALRAHDGRGPSTRLTRLYRQHLQGDVELLIPLVYRPLEPAGIARLARLVGEAAAAQDAVALGILDEAAGELALAVRAVAARLGLDHPPVAAVGGLFRELPGFSDLLARKLGRPDLECPRHAPVIGAIFMAAASCGYRVEHCQAEAWQRAVLAAGGHRL
ncbi:MAG: BadF/BadG/BcrA/BcrD ATPase family protein [Bacillota bacterium]